MHLFVSNTPGDAVDHQALASLQAIGGDDPEFVLEMIELFQRQTALNLELIARALSLSDLAGATSAAHHTKSSSLYLGARRLSELASQVERAACQGDVQAVSELFSAMKAEFAMVQRAFAARSNQQ